MIWEVDEDLDKKVDWNEFQLMYKKCIFDNTGLEPRRLFTLVILSSLSFILLLLLLLLTSLFLSLSLFCYCSKYYNK